jgi:hypothetical protein
MFSFINPDNSSSDQYNMLLELPKVKGAPEVAQQVLGEKIPLVPLVEKAFASEKNTDISFAIPPAAKTALKWFLQMPL